MWLVEVKKNPNISSELKEQKGVPIPEADSRCSGFPILDVATIQNGMSAGWLDSFFRALSSGGALSAACPLLGLLGRDKGMGIHKGL
jgi:hypothetical protein